jgi:hypothetical protein
MHKRDPQIFRSVMERLGRGELSVPDADAIFRQHGMRPVTGYERRHAEKATAAHPRYLAEGERSVITMSLFGGGTRAVSAAMYVHQHQDPFVGTSIEPVPTRPAVRAGGRARRHAPSPRAAGSSGRAPSA